ncbi:hypothetical protein PIB30_111678, partial [Stylosanthes scabra]|nr:hypothetical protein [Stylosanthes scabra]
MLGSSSVASGSHSRSRPHGSFANSQDRARSGKVPHWCGCGKRPVLRWSGTDANPKRPFFGCPNYNTIGKRWCDLFEWADYEEEDDMKYDNKNGTELSKKNLISRISNAEDEIRKLKR